MEPGNQGEMERQAIRMPVYQQACSQRISISEGAPFELYTRCVIAELLTESCNIDNQTPGVVIIRKIMEVTRWLF